MEESLVRRLSRLSELCPDPRSNSRHSAAALGAALPASSSPSERPAAATRVPPKWRAEEVQALRLSVQQAQQEAQAQTGQAGGEAAAVDWRSVQRKVAAVGAQRSAAECLIQWRNVQDPAINRAPWSKQEELHLIKAAKQYEEHDWLEISEELGTNRTPLQCLKHYQQTLNPTLVRQEWTEAEDERLAEAVRLYGTKNWQQVADCLPGRAAAQCALRWSKSAKANSAVRTGRWTETEERRLFLAVVALDMDSSSSVSWREVAELVPGRDASRCREKWVNVMDPELSRRPFTPSEDVKLLRLVEEMGPGQWAQVAKEMAGRTDNMCYRRWKALMDRDAQQRVAASRKRRKALPSQHGRKQERTAVEADDIDVSLMAHVRM